MLSTTPGFSTSFDTGGEGTHDWTVFQTEPEHVVSHHRDSPTCDREPSPATAISVVPSHHSDSPYMKRRKYRRLCSPT
jgi:hypothetical protein